MIQQPKTDGELAKLHGMGYDDLTIGIERKRDYYLSYRCCSEEKGTIYEFRKSIRNEFCQSLSAAGCQGRAKGTDCR